jgi:hypothetical protein
VISRRGQTHSIGKLKLSYASKTSFEVIRVTAWGGSFQLLRSFASSALIFGHFLRFPCESATNVTLPCYIQALRELFYTVFAYLTFQN